MTHPSGIIKWEMLSRNQYRGEKEGYIINLKAGSPNTWTITKDGVQIDWCYAYPPMNESANGKVQSEKVLNKILAK